MAPLPGIGSSLAGFQSKLNFKQLIVGAGLSSGLSLCLDVAELTCTTGGQSLTDLSGSAFNFNNGMTSSVESNDMVFTGTAGSRTKNTYFLNTDSSNGEGDSQGLKASVSNPSWITDAHKSTANFTLAGWFFIPGPQTGDTTFFTTFQIFWQSGTGFALAGGGGTNLYFYTGGNAHSAAAEFGGLSLPRDASWHFIAAGIKSGSTSWIQVDGNQQTSALTLSQTGSPTSAMTIAMNANKRWSTGLNSRFAGAFGWNTQLTTAQGLTLYNATRSRFQ